MKTIIETNHLRKEFVLSYFPKRTILACDDINIKIKEGEVVGIVGESGSGKSTLALCMSKLIQIESGKIIFENKDISALNNKQMRPFRKNIQLIFQDPYSSLNPRMKVKDLIAEGIKIHKVLDDINKMDDYVLNVLEKVGLSSNDLNKFPKDFSGGQRQRIAIARAMLADPRVLILDEATSNLDTESESLIQKSLAELMKGRTTFVIAHRLSTIRQATQILVIEQGKISERGTHDELIKSEGRYFELFTYQSKI